MPFDRRSFLLGGSVGLADILTNAHTLRGLSLDQPLYSAPGPLYRNDLLKWLDFGWENDHPKSWAFMGGAVSPGQRSTIQFAVTIAGKTYAPDELAPDRKQKIRWYLKEGFLPCPVSEWDAGPLHVLIQHFAHRVLHDTATAVYSRVELRATSSAEIPVRLEIGAGRDFAIPLSGEPDYVSHDRMTDAATVHLGKAVSYDFVSLANGDATPAQLAAEGGFDTHFLAMKQYWLGRIETLTHPIQLPSPMLADMYKALQIAIWENMVKVGNDYEIHAAPRTPIKIYDYDRTFSHDAPNYVDQYMREGDCELGKKMLDSSYYKDQNRPIFPEQNYLDTIGKYLLPFAEYLRVTGDLSYFTAERRADMKKATRNIHAARVFSDPGHYGLMQKSQDFENWAEGGDYLLCDNWGALHGLQAYKYICDALGDADESHWASDEMKDINDCLNHAIEKGRKENGSDYYLGSFDKASHLRYQEVDYSWVPYSGALSTFPWGAYLKGFALGGSWKERFDASIEYALSQRDEKRIPEGSWGSWWGHVAFGSTYNASAGVQCLFSDKYRTEAIKNVEFLASYQCAPFQWSEAFEYKGPDQWVGMYLPPVSYGNQDSWGYSFIKQALLQACASVKTDGTVILGRGIPNHWIFPGSVIEWANIQVNYNRKINFRIVSQEKSLELTISGDITMGEIRLNLPILKGNILSSSAGIIDSEEGSITLPANTRKVAVHLVSALKAVAESPTNGAENRATPNPGKADERKLWTDATLLQKA